MTAIYMANELNAPLVIALALCFHVVWLAGFIVGIFDRWRRP